MAFIAHLGFFYGIFHEHTLAILIPLEFPVDETEEHIRAARPFDWIEPTLLDPD